MDHFILDCISEFSFVICVFQIQLIVWKMASDSGRRRLPEIHATSHGLYSEKPWPMMTEKKPNEPHSHQFSKFKGE